MNQFKKQIISVSLIVCMGFMLVGDVWALALPSEKEKFELFSILTNFGIKISQKELKKWIWSKKNDNDKKFDIRLFTENNLNGLNKLDKYGSNVIYSEEIKKVISSELKRQIEVVDFLDYKVIFKKGKTKAFCEFKIIKGVIEINLGDFILSSEVDMPVFLKEHWIIDQVHSAKSLIDAAKEKEKKIRNFTDIYSVRTVLAAGNIAKLDIEYDQYPIMSVEKRALAFNKLINNLVKDNKFSDYEVLVLKGKTAEYADCNIKIKEGIVIITLDEVACENLKLSLEKLHFMTLSQILDVSKLIRDTDGEKICNYYSGKKEYYPYSLIQNIEEIVENDKRYDLKLFKNILKNKPVVISKDLLLMLINQVWLWELSLNVYLHRNNDRINKAERKQEVKEFLDSIMAVAISDSAINKMMKVISKDIKDIDGLIYKFNFLKELGLDVPDGENYSKEQIEKIKQLRRLSLEQIKSHIDNDSVLKGKVEISLLSKPLFKAEVLAFCAILILKSA